MNIFLFSQSEPPEAMLTDLGHPLTAQIQGIISEIRRQGDEIFFKETIGRDTVESSIPADAVVIVDAPLSVQEAWLNAGVATLLVPQGQQALKFDWSVEFHYTGLLEVKAIATQPWSAE